MAAVTITDIQTNPELPNFCPQRCSCFVSQISCRHIIPQNLSEAITDVELLQVPSTEIQPEKFCSIGWKNVKMLSITILPDPGTFFNMEDHTFDCLGELVSFKLSSSSLVNVTKFAFTRLSKVTTFDLSGCMHLNWQNLQIMFSQKHNLPKLEYLNISMLGSDRVLTLSQDFVNALTPRPVKCIDLSFNTLVLDFTLLDNICSTLTKLLIHDAIIMQSENFVHANTCYSLQTIDISRDRFFVNYFESFSCVNTSFSLELFPFYKAVRKLYLNSVVTSSKAFSVTNCKLALFLASSLTEFYFSGNFLPRLDVELVNGHLTILDLSYNQIENISVIAFRNLSSLEKLDLSHNNLGELYLFEETFSELFTNNTHLKVLNLSSNGLSYLPKDMFVSNRNLQSLNLSRNKFHQVTFNLSYFVSLNTLDLSLNYIQALDRISQQKLYKYMLYRQEHVTNKGINYSLEILLEGNPFLCSCSNTEFLKWFSDMQLLSSTQQSYFCEINGQKELISNAAIDSLQKYCSKNNHSMELVMVSSSLSAILGITSLITAILFYKWWKRNEREMRINALQMEASEIHFAVFVSYSSKDDDFVMSKVLQPLQVGQILNV